MASATYAQTREYLKPLLRKLRNKSLPEDITDSLTEIVKHLLDRNYIYVSSAMLKLKGKRLNESFIDLQANFRK